MTLEEMFVKDYQEIKEENKKLLKEKEEILIENEKEKKLLEIELNEKKTLLSDVAAFLKESRPKISNGGYLWLDSYLLSGEEKDKAIELLKKLGIAIEEEKNE